MTPDIKPSFRDIEEHIRRAKAKRAIVMADGVAHGLAAIARGFERAFAPVARMWNSRDSRTERRTLAAG